MNIAIALFKCSKASDKSFVIRIVEVIHSLLVQLLVVVPSA